MNNMKKNSVCKIFACVCVIVLQCKLIVCQMSNTRCQPLTWLLLPMALVVALAVSGVVANEVLLLYLWTAAVVLAHIHYGVSVVRAHTHTHTRWLCDEARGSFSAVVSVSRRRPALGLASLFFLRFLNVELNAYFVPFD